MLQIHSATLTILKKKCKTCSKRSLHSKLASHQHNLNLNCTPKTVTPKLFQPATPPPHFLSQHSKSQLACAPPQIVLILPAALFFPLSSSWIFPLSGGRRSVHLGTTFLNYLTQHQTNKLVGKIYCVTMLKVTARGC